LRQARAAVLADAGAPVDAAPSAARAALVEADGDLERDR
jgi:hypothetical protein